MRASLRDTRHNTIAYVKVDSRGVHTITDARHNVLGYYDPRTNRTMDRNHRTLGYGYLLPRLIPGRVAEDDNGIIKPMTPAEGCKEAERRASVQRRIQDARASCAKKVQDLRAKLVR